MSFECCYINARCDHQECGEWWNDPYAGYYGTGPTEADYCAVGGHAYYGDDSGIGRCYCGNKEYPLGGE